jgi:hypothetical protein
MSLQESGRCVKLAVYSHIDAIIGRLPEELKWFIMEILTTMWVCEPFADNGDKGSMVEISHMVFLSARVLHTMMKRDRD